jgi:glycerol kinase
MEKKYILSIDSGSTGIRAILFNHAGEILAREYEKTPALHPEPGAIEDDPELLWNALQAVVKKILDKFSGDEIAAIGITNQRATFGLWDKETGKPEINFINWADVRAADTCDKMNGSMKWKALKVVATIVSKLTGNPMMTATRMLDFTTDHCSTRLNWILNEKPELRVKCKAGNVLFGTLDTWYVYKLTGGKNHFTDYSNASASSMYNPFQLKWNDITCGMFDIPMSIFPEVKDTNGDFGVTDKEIFGFEIPIRAAVGDQMAALFGQCCTQPGDVKISQGSGAFVNMNVGLKAKVSKRGLFPLIAWGIDGVPTYMLEGFVATAGTLIDWLGMGIGLSDTPQILNEFAAQCEDTEGVIFVPTPSGIRFPYFNPRARGSIVGLSLSTHRRHVARAVLEGIALRLYDILDGMEIDTKIPIKQIKVDGGVSKSDILLQSLASFANITVKRAPESDMTATGAAYFAGLAVGFWKDIKELKTLEKDYNEFTPNMDPIKRKAKLKRWKRTLKAILKIE